MTDAPVPLSEQQTADKVRLDMIRDGEWDQASELELESEQWPFGNVGFLIRLVDEAREERDATLQQNERVMAALRPFALAADDLDEATRDGAEIWEMPAAMGITAGDLREAKAVLAALDSAASAAGDAG